jgi:Holliday junction resolvase-like predicted endonuclease
MQNWNLIFQRLKTRIAEIDLVFERNDKIILIEVKTLNSVWRANQRINLKQINKLKANRTVLSFFSKKKKVDAFVAWVSPLNVITFCKLD